MEQDVTMYQGFADTYDRLMDEIPYEKSSDPGQKNGRTTVLEITYNNDQKIMIISDDDYAVIRKKGKSYLYRK